MEYRHAGSSGLVVSLVGLGCINFGRTEPDRPHLDDETSRQIIEAALDSGVTFFDTAVNYGDSEEIVGKFLEGHRDDVVIGTKFGNPVGAGFEKDFGALGARRYVRRVVEYSLRRLRTDRIDLYQFHQPDPTTPMEETLSVLTDLVHEGKICYLGVSNIKGWQLADAEAIAAARGFERFITVQNRYNVLDRSIEDEVLPACAHYGMGIIPYSPLGKGLLSGKYRRHLPLPEKTRLILAGEAPGERQFDQLEAIERFAEERGVSHLEVAFGGLAAEAPVCSIIAGVTSADQVRSNVAAAEWSPGSEDMKELRRVLR